MEPKCCSWGSGYFSDKKKNKEEEIKYWDCLENKETIERHSQFNTASHGYIKYKAIESYKRKEGQERERV